MNRIAQFEKVSFEQFLKDYNNTFDYGENYKKSTEVIKEIWDNIKLPTRATKGSAGYDIVSPIDFVLHPHRSIKIPTGIRCQIEDGWVLKLYPRSSLGCKYRLQLDNTIGIIDSDYFYSNNEGHIFIKITNDANEYKIIGIKSGESFAQGIFVSYGITVDDNVMDIRNGGFGSTGK